LTVFINFKTDIWVGSWLCLIMVLGLSLHWFVFNRLMTEILVLVDKFFELLNFSPFVLFLLFAFLQEYFNTILLIILFISLQLIYDFLQLSISIFSCCYSFLSLKHANGCALQFLFQNLIFGTC